MDAGGDLGDGVAVADAAQARGVGGARRGLGGPDVGEGLGVEDVAELVREQLADRAEHDRVRR